MPLTNVAEYGEYLAALEREAWSRKDGLDLDRTAGPGTESNLGDWEGDELAEEEGTLCCWGSLSAFALLIPRVAMSSTNEGSVVISLGLCVPEGYRLQSRKKVCAICTWLYTPR
jgi:hypothetical protein